MSTAVLGDEPTFPPSIAAVANHAFTTWPDRTFLVTNGREYTYADAERETDCVAWVLAGQGVAVGTHVAVFMHNSPTMVWTLLAIARLGAVGVPLNVEAKGTLLRYYLTDSESTHLVVDATLLGVVGAAWTDPTPVPVCVHGDMPPVVPPFASSLVDLAAGADGSIEIEVVEGARTDPALLMYTSGTTGPSKAVVVPNGHALGTAALVVDRFEIGPDDRHFTCLPLFHANAYWYTLLPAMLVGSAAIVQGRFSARRFWSELATSRATITNVMGTMLQVLLRAEPSSDERRHYLSRMFVVPFPVDPAAVEDRFGAKLMTTYVLTEWVPVALSRPGEGYDRREMAGPILSDSEVRIVDEHDRDVPTGTIGEIVLRERQPWGRLIEYYGKPEATEQAFRGGWFHTGDLGRVDQDGYLYFAGRQKDSIRRRGENISSYELEMLLAEHPSIAEVAAIPFRSELGEDDVAVVVVCQPGETIDPEAVFEFASEALPRYMVPTYIRVADALPKTATSKVEKYRLMSDATSNPTIFWRRPGR